jgi:hypothetical protein
MKIFEYLRLTFIATLLILVSCSSTSGNDPETPVPDTKEKIKYTADYDDGSTIFINVKIAIDRKGWNALFKDKIT